MGHRVTEEGLLPDPSLPGCHRGHSAPEDSYGGALFSWSSRLLPPVRQGLCRYCRPLARSDQNRCALPLERGLPSSIRSTEGPAYYQPDHSFPDFSQAFRLYTDAYTAGLGAILAQVREGKERIICCASRALIRLKSLTQPPNWSAWRLCGQSPSSVHTSWPCHLRYLRIIMRFNG